MSNPQPPQTGAYFPQDHPDTGWHDGPLRSAAHDGTNAGAFARETYPADPPADRHVPLWEPAIVFFATLLALALLAPRIIAYLSPTTGDEPFYLMTAISILDDHDINECNNYRQRDEAKLYPPSVSQSHTLPAGWVGWGTPPYPLPPHPAKIEPASRRCLGSDVQANYVVPDTSWPLPADGTQSELYSKHGLGLSLLVTAPFGLGGRDLVVFFLNILGALLAVNIYLFARQATGMVLPAMLTWLAFSFTIPIMPYSYLIFPELPAALLVIYAFRRIWLGRNNSLQLFLIGMCIAFMPWLHYRFAPVSAGLALFFLYGLYRSKERPRRARLIDAVLVCLPVIVSAVGLMSYFYFLYHIPFPNGSDHAGISDVAGTIRGAVGSFIDEQWGLFTAAPVYILALVGLIVMAFTRAQHRNLLWLGVVALPYFGVISNYAQWWGEWCPPARYLTSILPLLALPFSYVLAHLTGVRAAIYGVMYAALTAVSYLATWGFVTQPQWLYNQPNGQAQLLLKGLPQVLGMLPSDLRPNLNLVDNLPSFVIPYFAYLLKGKTVGDQWAALAWQKSIMPLAVVGVIVAVGLALAAWEWRVSRRGPGNDLTSGDEAVAVGRVRRVETAPETPVTTPFRLVPALAFATPLVSPRPFGVLVLPFSGGRATLPTHPAPHEELPESPGSGPPDLPAPRASGVVGLLGRLRPLALGLASLGVGLYGQKMALEHEIVLSIRWYALAILLWLVAWASTYRNRSLVRVPLGLPGRADTQESAEGRSRRFQASAFLPHVARYALALVALGLNLGATAQLRATAYASALGGWLWLASVLLLAVAFVGYKPAPGKLPDEQGDRVEERTDFRLDRWLEFAILLAIFALALGLRLYRLGDWTTGVHGDEGEAGMDALSILNGSPAPPFQTGWFEQSNFYYWGIALTMKIFGTGLFGLRMFSTLAGALLVLPLYGLVRQWFGVRCAVIAGVLVGISDVAIHFSRQEFSNITTPLFLCTGFYFLFRGLRSGRVLDFVLAAYASMLTVYFYLGGRLTPFLMGAVLLYIFLLMPLVRLPGLVRDIRRDATREGQPVGVGPAVLRAVRATLGPLRVFAAPIAIGALAAYVFAAPFFYYYLDNRALVDMRTQDKLVFNNAARMQQQYALTHDPLYVGLRAPRADDVLPPSPLVFEPTALSVQVAPDGFWPRVLWHQLTTTLSLLTYRQDGSQVYTFTGEPITKPIEVVLVVLGIAWALWRWRDTRMAVLSMWFWSTILVGGVATIDAPYMARLVGIIPALAIFAAISLDKLAAHLADFVRGLAPRSLSALQAGQLAGAALVVALLGYLSSENAIDYYGRYLGTYPFTVATGQAVFVGDMVADAEAAGRPAPTFYNLGAPVIYWTYGVNRFLNNGVPGADLLSPASVLPLANNDGRDVVFLVWEPFKDYLRVLQAYYPDGDTIPFIYGPEPSAAPLFTAFRVSTASLAAHRYSEATYTPPGGQSIARHEAGLGTSSQPPPDLTYPVRASWTSQLIAPAFARYGLRLRTSGGGSLVIDGTPVLVATPSSPEASAEVLLARGPHDVLVQSTLASSSDAVMLDWSAGDSGYMPVDSTYLWQGAGRGLLAEIRPATVDLSTVPPPDAPSAGDSLPVVNRRVDGLLGFRSGDSLRPKSASFSVDWTGQLDAPSDGEYTFEVAANSEALLAIDGQTVVNTRAAPQGNASVDGAVALRKGTHNLLLRYNWNGGNAAALEAYWTPPGGLKSLLGPGALHTAGGLWVPGSITEPPPYTLPAVRTSAASTQYSPLPGHRDHAVIADGVGSRVSYTGQTAFTLPHSECCREPEVEPSRTK